MKKVYSEKSKQYEILNFYLFQVDFTLTWFKNSITRIIKKKINNRLSLR